MIPFRIDAGTITAFGKLLNSRIGLVFIVAVLYATMIDPKLEDIRLTLADLRADKTTMETVMSMCRSWIREQQERSRS